MLERGRPIFPSRSRSLFFPLPCPICLVFCSTRIFLSTAVLSSLSPFLVFLPPSSPLSFFSHSTLFVSVSVSSLSPYPLLRSSIYSSLPRSSFSLRSALFRCLSESLFAPLSFRPCLLFPFPSYSTLSPLVPANLADDPSSFLPWSLRLIFALFTTLYSLVRLFFVVSLSHPCPVAFLSPFHTPSLSPFPPSPPLPGSSVPAQQV